MTDADTPARPAPKKNIFAQLELDTRLLGMIGAFVILCLGFHFITDGMQFCLNICNTDFMICYS